MQKFCIFILALSVVITMSCTSCGFFGGAAPFDASAYEAIFAPPYVLEGSLKFNGGTYKINITRDVSDNTAIFFYDGDITQGLTISFSGDDVFLSFDDLRFKTNAQIFTDLRTLDQALNVMEHSMYPKQFQPAGAGSGPQQADLLTAQADGGTVSLYINHADGTPLRLQSDVGGVSLFVDITSISNQKPEQTTTAAYTTQMLPPILESTAIEQLTINN